MVDQNELKMALIPHGCRGFYHLPRVQGPSWAAYSAAMLGIRSLIMVDLWSEVREIVDQIKEECWNVEIRWAHQSVALRFNGAEKVVISTIQGRPGRMFDQVLTLEPVNTAERAKGLQL